MPVGTKVNLLNYDRAGMEEFFQAIGEPRYRAQQALQWLHQYGHTDFAKMTNFSKALRAKLEATAEITLPQQLYHQISKDATQKWLLKLDCVFKPS